MDASEAEQLEAPAVHRGCAGHVGARCGSSVQAEVNPTSATLEERQEMIRRIALSLGALTVLALAVGAGFKP